MWPYFGAVVASLWLHPYLRRSQAPSHKVCSPVCKGGMAVLVGFMVEWQVTQGQGESSARLCRVTDGDAFGATHLHGGVVFWTSCPSLASLDSG